MIDILNNPHFKDLIDTPHLIDGAERLPGSDGTPGAGLKLSEAVPLAEMWWEQNGRFHMPDYGKDPHEIVARSGVLMGLPWFNLDKQEMLRVLSQWYANVGVHTIIEGKSTSQDSSKVKTMGDLRETAKGILPILNTDGTHSETSSAIEANIEQEKTLVDAQGEKLKPKD